MSETYTKGPWEWSVHDYTMITLHGPNEQEDHVVSVSPCAGCLKSAKKEQDNKIDWDWGKCRTPSLEDANLMAASPELLEALERCWSFINQGSATEMWSKCGVCFAVSEFIPEQAKEVLVHKETCWYNNAIQKAIGRK